MNNAQTIRLVYPQWQGGNIAGRYNLAGLTIAEPMPRIAIKLKNMLCQLPLLK